MPTLRMSSSLSVRPLYAFLTWTGTIFFVRSLFWSRISSGTRLCHRDWQVAIVFVSLWWGCDFLGVYLNQQCRDCFCSYHSVPCQEESPHTEGLIWQLCPREGHWTRERCRMIIWWIIYFLISNFRRVLNVVCFLLGNSPASEFYMPTFRDTLFHLHRQVGTYLSMKM